MYPMENTKTTLVLSVHKDRENPDPRLDFMPDILAKLRRAYLAHEPGTEAQASSYKLYKTYLDRHLAGEMYVPKF